MNSKEISFFDVICKICINDNYWYFFTHFFFFRIHKIKMDIENKKKIFFLRNDNNSTRHLKKVINKNTIAPTITLRI